MRPVFSQLTAARLTPTGRGAVASIRVQRSLSLTDGKRNHVISVTDTNRDPHCPTSIDRFFRASNQLPLWNQPVGKIAFGHWGVTDSEDLVVCRIDTNITEIHCHGGDAAVERILQDLHVAGYTIVDWHTQLSLQEDTLEVEGLEVLSHTTTWRTTQIVLEQLGGLLRGACSHLARLDPSDGDAVDGHLDRLLHWSDFGLHLSSPWRVVLTGRPNVGKSSLINALLGYQRAIVFDEPGTTRDVVTGETAFEGWPVTLADTAGIRTATGEIEAAGIEMAREHLSQADLPLVLVDVSQEPTPEDLRILAEWPDALVVAHKADQPDQWGDRMPTNAQRVSSITGQGMAELQRALVQRLIPEIPAPDTPIPLTTRQVNRLRDARAAKSSDERRRSIRRLLDERLIDERLIDEKGVDEKGVDEKGVEA